MKIFLDELEKRHRASIKALYGRHKPAVGYAALCIGLVLAFAGISKALHHADAQRERISGIVCQNITRTDRQTLSNLHSKVDQELIKNLHLSKEQVTDSVNQQLRLSAEQRKALQPSSPRGSCSASITTLRTPVPRKVR